MTTMDSDSESQDSDDGRRFRFEATRKDPVMVVDTTSRAKSTKKKSKHRSHCEGDKHRDRKERSKHENARKTDDKDLRHLIRHSKSWNSRQENGSRNSHKDRGEARDISAGSVANDRSSRNSNGGGGDTGMRERSRDSRRQSVRDRSAHRGQRSREHSYEKSHDERASSNKHRSRCRERHKHRSRDKIRDRSYQSNRVRSSSGDRLRENHGKHDSCKKTSMKEDRSQNSRDYSSPKNIERASSHGEARSTVSSSENTRKDLSMDAQDYKDLDLSQFDVLSETDENMSDDPGTRSRASSPRHCKSKLKGHDSGRVESSESRGTKRERKQHEERKVKIRNEVSGSSDNNPSTISDSSLGFASSATVSVTRESCADSARGELERYEEERAITRNRGELSDSEETYSRAGVSSGGTRLSGEGTVVEQSRSVYGPFLPTEFASNISCEEKLEETSLNILDDSRKTRNEASSSSIDDGDDERMNFIGPHLSRTDEIGDTELKDRQSGEQEDTGDTATEAPTLDVTFGPALPPHLLQRKCDDNLRDRIIGPVLPSTVKSHEENSGAETDDDCAIGPLPANHPALRDNRVHEQLDLRAQRIRNEGYMEEVDVKNKREEWMTELPPAQAASLGLGPRKFRLRDGPDMSDRSCWTDTPAQKAQKWKDLEARRVSNVQESDEKCVKEFCKKDVHRSSKREKSLLEIHQHKVAKKRKKEEKEAKLTGRSTRRPFDRNIDLQVNRFDQAQKKTILMKAQLLDDRFSHGQI